MKKPMLPTINVSHDLEREMLRAKRVLVMVDDVHDCLAMDLTEDLTLMVATSTEPVTLVIGSDGGDMMSMLTILDAIAYAQHEGVKFTGRVQGRAMSAAFIILQACDERVMTKTGYLMAHGQFSFSIGDIKDQEVNVTFSKRVRDKVAHLIAKRGKGKYAEVDFWKKLLTENTPVFLDSDQALEWGVIDRVEE